MIEKMKKIIYSPRWSLTLILFLTLLSFSNIFNNLFVLDDFHFFVNWPLIEDIKNFPQFFTAAGSPFKEIHFYAPLKTLLSFLAFQSFGLYHYGYHAVSLLIHFAAITAVYRISFLLVSDRSIAFLSSLLFALHPVCVESVTYISASFDNLGVVFFLNAFLYYLHYTNTKKRKYYVLSFLFSTLAMFTYESTIVLPVLLCWYIYCFPSKNGSLKKELVQIIPFLLVSVNYLLLKSSIFGSLTSTQYLYESKYLTFLVMIKALAKYVYLVFIPWTLTINHVISQGIFSFDTKDFDKFALLNQSLVDPQVILSLFLLFGAVFVVIKFRHRIPLVSFCIGAFFISLLPVFNMIPSGIFFSERYLYKGLFAFCLLLAYAGVTGIQQLKTKGKAPLSTVITFFFIALVCFYAIRTFFRNRDWQKEIILYTQAIKVNPQSALLRKNLAQTYLRIKKFDLALENLNKALAIKPDDPVIYFAIGEIYINKRDNEEAIENFKKSIELNPSYAESCYNLAGLYALEKRMEESEKAFTKARELYYQQNREEEFKTLEKAFRTYFYPQETIEQMMKQNPADKQLYQ